MTMLSVAKSVREMAYAPYSGFKVGAAICTPTGKIFSGCNVENVAYPEGTCAEAGAIAAMIAAGQTRISAVVVIADSPMPVSPCGGCRQKLAEFSDPDMKVTMTTLSGNTQEMTIAQLLPGAFTPKHMAGA